MAVVPTTGGVTLGGTADVTFTPGGGQVDAGLVLEWDFDNDGDFSEADEDITDVLYDAETRAGRDFPSNVTGLAGPGALRATLRNDDDRFNIFNADSPLNEGANSLRTGRKVRLRTTDATDVDPALLLRDRFGTDGVLTVAETGQAWTTVNFGGQDAWFVSGGRARPTDDSGSNLQYATADVGVDDHYVQATIGAVGDLTSAGVVARFTDDDNLVRLRVISTSVELEERVAGVTTTLGFQPVRPWDGMVVGLSVQGSTVTAYVGGAPVHSDTLASASGGTRAGLVATWNGAEAQPPSFADVWVFEDVSQPIEGVLWTGDISDVRPAAPVAGRKTASVTGEGWLARAALADVAAPRLPLEGTSTGLLVGDVLAKAALLHPPGPINEGVIVTGPIGIEDGKALALARQFEETEIGFIHETNEGPIGYFNRDGGLGLDSLGGTTAAVTFCDGPGPGLGYSDLTPYDQRRAIVNRVTAGVAPSTPSGIVPAAAATYAGTADVDITLPTVQARDLLVLVVANSKGIDGNGVDWLVPRFWTEHRNLKATVGMRIYSHICDGTESGTTPKFFADGGTIAGIWVATLWRIRGWYGSPSGLSVGTVTSGHDPAGVAHGWGRQPTLFMLFATGIGSTAGSGDYNPNYVAPHGYETFPGTVAQIASTGANQYEVAWAAAYKIDATESEDPGTLNTLTGFTVNESVVVAARGYDGELAKATGPVPGQPAGRFVTLDDLDSQHEQRAVRSHTALSNLFATEPDATEYAGEILSRHADDRPIFSLTFPATLSAAHRAQAIRRRVGDKIHLIATGATGQGVEGDFVIESIAHKPANAGKQWRVTWELSLA